MDLTKLSVGDKVLAGSGIALFVFSFFPWFGVEGFGGGGNAWDVGFFTGILPTLIGLALVGYVVVTKLVEGVNLPELPVPYALVVLGLAALAAFLVVLRLLIGYKVRIPFGPDLSLDRKAGLFLSSLAALGLAGGAFLKFQEEGGELPRKGGSGDRSDSGGTPTPF